MDQHNKDILEVLHKLTIPRGLEASVQGFLAEKELEIFQVLKQRTDILSTQLILITTLKHVSNQSEKSCNKELAYNTLSPHPHILSISAIWDISRASDSFLKLNYSLEVKFTCPQANGRQTSGAEKMEHKTSLLKIY